MRHGADLVNDAKKGAPAPQVAVVKLAHWLTGLRQTRWNGETGQPPAGRQTESLRMGNLKFYLVIGIVALVAVAVAFRVDAVRKIVTNAPEA